MMAERRIDMEVLWVVVALAAWIGIMRWVLPRFGVGT